MQGVCAGRLDTLPTFYEQKNEKKKTTKRKKRRKGC